MEREIDILPRLRTLVRMVERGESGVANQMYMAMLVPNSTMVTSAFLTEAANEIERLRQKDEAAIEHIGALQRSITALEVENADLDELRTQLGWDVAAGGKLTSERDNAVAEVARLRAELDATVDHCKFIIEERDKARAIITKMKEQLGRTEERGFQAGRASANRNMATTILKTLGIEYNPEHSWESLASDAAAAVRNLQKAATHAEAERRALLDAVFDKWPVVTDNDTPVGCLVNLRSGWHLARTGNHRFAFADPKAAILAYLGLEVAPGEVIEP